MIYSEDGALMQKNSMVNDTKTLLTILRQAEFLKEMARWFGGAEIVAICMKRKKRQRSAQPVCIPRPILSFWVKTGSI
jgi:hypothetical protein